MYRYGGRKFPMFILGLFIGALLISPAGAHVSNSIHHLWSDHIKPRLASKGSLNASGNPVHWTKLKSVPEGVTRLFRLDKTGQRWTARDAFCCLIAARGWANRRSTALWSVTASSLILPLLLSQPRPNDRGDL
jgi:hypothetical protein